MLTFSSKIAYMKSIFTLLLFSPFFSNAQYGELSNGSFEDWTVKDSSVQLLTWNYINIVKSDLVTRVDDAQHGDHACRLETIHNTNGDTLTSYLAFGDFSSGTFRPAAYNSFVDSLVFWGRWDMAPGDTGMIQVIQYINGNPTPVNNTKYYYGTESNWTRVAMKMISPGQDSLRILVHTRGYGTQDVPVPGSYLDIDNIHFVKPFGTTPQLLPNYSFEDWFVNPYSDPDGFYSLNQVLNDVGRVPNTTRTTDAYAGDYAVKLAVDTNSTIQGVLTNAYYYDWALESGAPYSAMPDSFSGFYKANVVAGDSALFQLYFSRNDTITYYHGFWIDSTVDWTPINLSINLPSQPDSMRIYCRSSKVRGSELYLDEFKFHGGNVGVREINLEAGVYPNPVKSLLTINANQAIKLIKVYSEIGEMVYAIRPQSALAILDMSNYKSGLYFVRITTDNGEVTKKVLKE
jgi:hypothetical protein